MFRNGVVLLKFIPILIVSIGILWAYFYVTPSHSQDFHDIEEKLLDTIVNSYGGTRFDRVSVQLEACKLSIYVEDTNICSRDYSIFATRKDLYLHNYSHVYGADPQQFDPAKAVVMFRTNSDAYVRLKALSTIEDTMLYNARNEFGWGLEAAVNSSQTFMNSHNDFEGVDLETSTYCSGESTASLIRGRFFLNIRGGSKSEYEEFINLMNSYISMCNGSK